MDKGAHFYKTDFQIHSPRDAQWIGDGVTQWPQRKPISPVERLKYARRFIAKCRELGIGAVGITDHHDICFIKYYQIAAQEESGTANEPMWANFRVQPKLQNPIVFPGMEVTLQVPCQCIILLDADSDPTIQASLLEAINVGNRYSDDEPNGPNVIPLGLNIQKLDNSTVISSRCLIPRYRQAFSFNSAILITVISSTISRSFL